MRIRIYKINIAWCVYHASADDTHIYSMDFSLYAMSVNNEDVCHHRGLTGQANSHCYPRCHTTDIYLSIYTFTPVITNNPSVSFSVLLTKQCTVSTNTQTNYATSRKIYTKRIPINTKLPHILQNNYKSHHIRLLVLNIINNFTTQFPQSFYFRAKSSCIV